MNFFTPQEIAKNYIKTGIAKTKISSLRVLILGILAGAFIGLAGVGATTIAVSVKEASLAKFLGALVFPTGLAMVVIAGSELFTGNNLLIIPVLEKKIKLTQMLQNWLIVYIGNFIGGILVALAVVYGKQLSLFNDEMAVSVISTAISKCSLSFNEALIKGICCNFLVCIAVWMTFAAKDVTGKIVALYLPIMLFVLCGFEHSIANMYYISAGLFAKFNPVYLEKAITSGLNLNNLTWINFFVKNLIPVTIGNIIGGAFCVGFVYWFVYLKKDKNNK